MIGERYSPILLATVSVERQTNMNTKEIREQKASLKLTEKQRDIVVGLLLGDGHLETQNSGRTYRLKVEHGALQRDYVEWLFGELHEWIPRAEPYMKLRRNGDMNEQKGPCGRLYIPSESARTFEQLTKEYILPIAPMDHKLVTHA